MVTLAQLKKKVKSHKGRSVLVVIRNKKTGKVVVERFKKVGQARAFAMGVALMPNNKVNTVDIEFSDNINDDKRARDDE